MIATLAVPVTLPEMISPMLMLNLFAFDEPIHSFLRKRPCIDKDPKDRQVCVRSSEEKDWACLERVEA